MPRPRKSDGDKLVSVSTNLHPRDLAAFERVAQAKGVTLAELLRVVLTSRFRNFYSDDAATSLTL